MLDLLMICFCLDDPRTARVKEGPTLQYVCRKSLYFQSKGPKLILRGNKKKCGAGMWLSRRVVRVQLRVVYGFTTPLRRREMMIEILSSTFLIVNLSWQSCVGWLSGMVKSRSSCISLCTRSWINFAKRSFSLDFTHVDMLKFFSSRDLI